MKKLLPMLIIVAFNLLNASVIIPLPEETSSFPMVIIERAQVQQSIVSLDSAWKQWSVDGEKTIDKFYEMLKTRANGTHTLVLADEVQGESAKQWWVCLIKVCRPTNDEDEIDNKRPDVYLDVLDVINGVIDPLY